MTRLYTPIPLSLNTEIELPEEAAHHFIKVLRARVAIKSVYLMVKVVNIMAN